MQILGTLCYLKRHGKTLMMYRNRKKNDIHEGKWNGLGGKIEPGESPTECAIREIREECGLEARAPLLKGVLTFPQFAQGNDWIVFLFRVDIFDGVMGECNEGDLHWIDDDKLLELELWEGDRVFMPYLDVPGFFTGKFLYKKGILIDYTIEWHCGGGHLNE